MATKIKQYIIFVPRFKYTVLVINPHFLVNPGLCQTFFPRQSANFIFRQCPVPIWLLKLHHCPFLDKSSNEAQTNSVPFYYYVWHSRKIVPQDQ